ncbi:hypothetical protein FN976_17045 [Caenimonas sedimenti]|uniref:Uncharacterized protein n=1 Tax=Caenimonas sedimenti TaxID=2596921 RepID=A0A562ZNV4_9BURK|nr:hypothetical protein [Caenimonas sedimenti]TWO70046.1 hypothetical protein FN976_17045 [Caenimonas sedimenti]
MTRRTRTFLTAAALAASFPLAAQPASPPSAEAAPYRSAFEGYRPFEAIEIQDWRKSNDTVREIGGWRAYAREIHGGTQSQPQSTPVQPPTRPEASASAPAAAPGAPAAPARPANPHQGHQR